MNNYDELKTLYDKLLLENERLRFENGVFRDRLRDLNVDIESLLAVNEDSLPVLAEDRNTQNKILQVNMQSSKEDKITLFRSLFKGRDDVFARRWYSAKTGKSGYQPVCLNEWNSYLCDKKKYKCATCPHRKLKSISDEVIENHLRGKDSQGKDVLGIYPMLKDEACHFLALDFDDAEYEKDVLAFKGVAQEHEIPVYIERSRSGNGAHVWIFFAECVPSYLARKLGSGLLTFAMSSRSDIKFDSYDRLFPNQDNMPHGGFGNLIALPLQGLARKNGNSVFVDDDFAPIKDQWAYLSEAKKITLVEVEGKVAVLCVNSDLGELVTTDEESENKKPWQNARKTVISKEDFTCSEVEIVEAGTIYIGKAGLSQKVQTQIKRLVSFRNPDFYKSQAMRLPIYNKPRIITLAEDDGDYISIPRGGKESLVRMLENADVSYKIVDERNFGKEIQAEFKGKLREKQSLAVNALLAHDTGVLSATTAFGKTVVSANIIAKHKTNTLVLVHTQSLLSQWQKSLEEFLILQQPEIDVEDQPKKRGRKKQLSPVGILGGGKNTLNGKVDVAIMQSLFEGGEVKELVRNYGQIIVDECHHVSAVNFEKILKCASARYVYGLTATPTRQDGHHPIIFLQCGDIRYRVDAKTEAGNRPFEHYISPRFTKLKVTAIKDEKQISQIYNDIAKNSERNKMIVGDVVSALGNGRTPLVLTERVGHVELLSELLKDKCENIVKLVGTMSAKEKRLASEKLAEYKDCDSLVIIATGKYVG
ncbi:MAG: DEAD/DEAH box helicase family protein [Bacillota bacterium]